MISKFLKTFLGIILVPAALGFGKAFYLFISNVSLFSDVLHIMERGILAYLLFHIFVIRPVYLYVLGHESVHVLATWLCGGKVVSFNVTPSGGNVVTSKTNFFIELSPYFVPIYTVIIGPVYIILESMGRTNSRISAIFVFFVGVTLAFHFVMTSDVIRMKQPDIIKSGFVFSFVTIFILNLIVVAAVFAPIFSDISFIEFIRSAWENSMGIYMNLYRKTLEIINTIMA